MSFQFKNYSFDEALKQANFEYVNNGIEFKESITFSRVVEGFNSEVLEKALFLAFILIGTSYYKTFPTQQVELLVGEIDEWQAEFFSSVYQDGLSQFASENKIARSDLAHFVASSTDSRAIDYTATDQSPLVLQSGGKDSLLLAMLLGQKPTTFDAWYLSSGNSYPQVLNTIGSSLITAMRCIDREKLTSARDQGALDGHVPVTYIVQAIALVQAVLLGKDTVLLAIGHEGEESYAHIGDLPVRHQWSKIWESEKQFVTYVQKYVSPSVKVGSPLRQYSELKVAELFVKNCWTAYSGSFSSCNVGNYKQGQDNSTLGWCGNCPKCANSFILFAPFVASDDLKRVFNGENLLVKSTLQDTFKGLLGIDGVEKPFECIGEEAELRLAYHIAHSKDSAYELPFTVPESNFDYNATYEYQTWTDTYI
ncbi:hypothetical protein KBD20_00470 [Candidatus Saccharibacteria bacterium]|nr:hypothetical protein [Candidatus Saccharibacteria bacterium]